MALIYKYCGFYHIILIFSGGHHAKINNALIEASLINFFNAHSYNWNCNQMDDTYKFLINCRVPNINVNTAIAS